MKDIDNTKQFIIYRLRWFGVYAVMAYLIFVLLPRPIDIVVAIGVLVLFYFFRKGSITKRYPSVGRINYRKVILTNH